MQPHVAFGETANERAILSGVRPKRPGFVGATAEFTLKFFFKKMLTQQ
jgi:hypothetical protein